MYSKILLFSILLVGYPFAAASQSVVAGVGARHEAVGSLATAAGVWSLWRNPAGLTIISRANVGFSNQKLNDGGLIQSAALVATRLGSFRSCLAIASLGDDIYRESAVSFGLSHLIGIHSIGVRADWFELRIEGERPRRVLGLSFGSRSKVSDQVTLCAAAQNVNLPRWEPGHPLPMRLAAGVLFEATKDCTLSAEIVKETQYEPSLRAGAEYGVRQKVFLRTGYQLQPNTAFAGLGLIAWQLHFDYALRFSYFLGLAQQLGITWQIEKRSLK